MPQLHNQINRMWFKPEYDSFRKSHFVRHIFSKNDANDFLKTGAYLIQEADKLSKVSIGWDESRRNEILNSPRLENAFISLGTEYLLKGVYLHNGYAINVPLPGTKETDPILINRNRKLFNPSKVQYFRYIKLHIAKIIDFTEFDKTQTEQAKGEKFLLREFKLSHVPKITTPYPTAIQLLDYVYFKRNYALHRPFIIPEFIGITKQQFLLLDYIANKGTGNTIKNLASLTK
jgi:hypothetical protein